LLSALDFNSCIMHVLYTSKPFCYWTFA